jgi:hypothetical protein
VHYDGLTCPSAVCIEVIPLWARIYDLVVHYDGMTCPSAVCIEIISLWARLYDLPPVMMESCAKQLGGQVGKYIKMDSRYPGYL